MKAAALIVAAGRGTRAGSGLPKQYRPLAGRPVLERTLSALAGHAAVSALVVVLHPDDRAMFASIVQPPDGLSLILTDGGATRDASVRAGLDVVPSDCEVVLIHDAARPLVSMNVIDGVLTALQSHPGAAPALAVTDALWTGADGRVTGTRDRTGLYRAQTPQGFHLGQIRAAHAAHPGGAADDVEVARAYGLDVAMTEGDETNIKITLPQDFARAEMLLASTRGTAMDLRLGNGYDVHKFRDGDGVILCGVHVPHDKALLGHSDADVGMHAITDAIYGALAEGDIGRHFPPSDPQWKGAASEIFLHHAVELAAARGFAIANVDCTLVCEMPKIGPHAGAMQARLSAIMGLDQGRISVKATTSEKLGFTGRGEGIAAIATAALVSA